MADISSIAAASGGLRTGLKSMMLSTSCDGGGDVDFDGPSSSNPRDTVSRVVSFGLIKKFPHNFEKCFIHKPRCDHCSKRIKINKVRIYTHRHQILTQTQ